MSLRGPYGTYVAQNEPYLLLDLPKIGVNRVEIASSSLYTHIHTNSYTHTYRNCENDGEI